MNSNLDEKLKEWLKWDQDPQTLKEIKKLADSGQFDHLKSLLCNRLTFGTAGIRGRMGAGFNQMNDLVIIQTSQGLAKYLLKIDPLAKNSGVVIGFDGRYHSKSFAERTAVAFLSQDIPVYLFSQIVPTPFIPFAIRTLKCSAGVMVTASHNPKEDNGYKVYFSNGAQIVSPHDKGIQDSILGNLEPWKDAWKRDKLSSVIDKLSDIEKQYYDTLKNRIISSNTITSTDLKFVYTAMHGVGYRYAMNILKICGFKQVFLTEAQVQPDPEFPTVKFPNPEEEGALDLSIQTARQHRAQIVFANDPDADRLAIAERQPGGSYKAFTGNETGILLGHWLWTVHKQKEPNKPAKDCYMLSSTVSTEFLGTLAMAEGFNFVQTLTGFKWMGNEADDLMKKGKKVLYAFEEALGHMCGTHILDKDGLTAMVEVGQMAAYLYSNGLTLQKQLENLYTKYGRSVTMNSYFICNDSQKIEKTFANIANWKGSGTYPQSLGPFKIVRVRDLQRCFDSSTKDKRPTLPCSSSSFMITFYLDNNVVLTIRTSGTEPKVKYYSEIISKPGESEQEASKQLRIVTNHMKTDLLRDIAF